MAYTKGVLDKHELLRKNSNDSALTLSRSFYNLPSFLNKSTKPSSPVSISYVKISSVFLCFSSSMASDSDAESSFLEQLISSRNRDLSLLLPLILGFSNSRRSRNDDEENPSSSTTDQRRTQTQDRIILINPFTQGMIVIETSRSLDAILREISDKDGLPPASKSSIELMPKVEITEEDLGGECAICLEGWEIGSDVKEMPCKHKYHLNCIEKWLGIHGSCPVCRFEMPVDVDDDDDCKKRNGEEAEVEPERDTSFEREVWVSFSFNRRRNSTTTTTTEPERDTVAVHGSSSESSINEEEEEQN